MSVFHKGTWVQRFGTSCGYWTNAPGKLDNHVLAHARAGKTRDLFDVFEESYRGEKLHQCADGVN